MWPDTFDLDRTWTGQDRTGHGQKRDYVAFWDYRKQNVSRIKLYYIFTATQGLFFKNQQLVCLWVTKNIFLYIIIYQKTYHEIYNLIYRGFAVFFLSKLSFPFRSHTHTHTHSLFHNTKSTLVWSGLVSNLPCLVSLCLSFSLALAFFLIHDDDVQNCKMNE